MRYLAQREHVLKSLNVLLSYLYSLSYILFPSFTLFAARWIIQYAWLALQKEVARHQLRWGIIPLSILLASLCVHCFTIPGTPIILDFIGQQESQSLIVVLLLDLVIAFLELLVAAIFYDHVISYANVLNRRDPHHHHHLHAASSFKPYTTRRDNFVLDMSFSLFFKLLFNPRSLLAESTRSQVPVASETTQDREEDTFLGASTSRLSGLPLPFNLGSTASNRARAGENPIPGSLARDW